MLSKIVEEVSREFRRQKKTLSLAESCTGGAIAAALVELPGASDFFLGSIVAYANEWKQTFLGVSTLDQFGAVSSETVVEMASHLLQRGHSDLCAAVSGIAGPLGGTLDKPVGTVWIAIGERGHPIEAHCIQAKGSRKQIIEITTQTTLEALLRKLQGKKAFK